QTPADLANRLQDAICSQKAEAARQAVVQLCQSGGSIRVFPQSSEGLLVKVFFRDRDKELPKPRLFKFSTASTVAELKMRVASELEIPRQAQCCVACGRIPPDSTPLGELEHKHEVVVHLYLLSKDLFKHRWGQQRPPPAPGQPAAPAPVAAAAPAQKMWAEPLPQPPALRPQLPEPPMQPQPPVPENIEPGWSCPICTYRNPPERPGCEMCASERPADYLNAADENEYEVVP
ncbi:hypothetical protein BOX15_Mlig027610g1, partial [Macrostomum lignano]